MNWESFFIKYNIDWAKFLVSRDRNEIKSFAKKIKYPVYLKANDLNHKSDKGGVIFVQSPKDMETALQKIYKLSKTFLVQESVKGREIIIGCSNDKTFGSYIMVGLGGIFTEAIGDVAYGINPIDIHTAKRMIEKLKFNMILGPYRGNRNAKEDIAKLLVKLSNIAYKEKINFEFNPVIITDKSMKVVDFR